MHVSVIGAGYVGATLAGCLADLGHEVTAVDTDPTVVERIEQGAPPMAEPGLAELYDAHASERIRATTDSCSSATSRFGSSGCSKTSGSRLSRHATLSRRYCSIR